MASVRQLKEPNREGKRPWVVEYTDPNGKRRRLTPKSGLKKDADALRRRVEAEMEGGIHVADSLSATVEKACKLWIEHNARRYRQGRISYSHRNRTATVIRNHILPSLGPVLLNRLDFLTVERWHAGLIDAGLLPITAKSYLMTLVQVEGFARRHGMTKARVASDVCRDIRGVRSAKVRTFTEGQMRALLRELEVQRVAKRGESRSAAPPLEGQTRRGHATLRCFVYLAAFCGLRYGEISALTLSSIDLDGNRLSVRHSLDETDRLKGPKKAGVREVPMPGVVAEILRAFIAEFYAANDRELLFRTRNGTRIKASNFHLWQWRPMLRRAGLEKEGDTQNFHFHALRHFFASALIDRLMPPADVALLMGHNSFDLTLQTYTHSITDDRRQHTAIEAVALRLASPVRDTNATLNG